MEDNTQDLFMQQAPHVMKTVLEVTSRIDERVRIMIDRQTETDRKLSNLLESVTTLAARVQVLEARDIKSVEEGMERAAHRLNEAEKSINILQLQVAGTEWKWKSALSFIGNLALGILIAYASYKFGIQP